MQTFVSFRIPFHSPMLVYLYALFPLICISKKEIEKPCILAEENRNFHSASKRTPPLGLRLRMQGDGFGIRVGA